MPNKYLKNLILFKIIFGDIMKEHSLKDSFKDALNGIVVPIRKERNLNIHIVIMILAIIAGFLLKISKAEWIICIILFSLVISAEIMNFAIENAINYTRSVTKNEDHKLAGIAKDASAGAVLVLATASAIIGLAIFLPKIIELI